MSVTLIHNALPGESLIGIEPELLQQVDAGWLHRLSLFSGRPLTATALQSEQRYRAGRLAALGQSVTPGTVKGLELSVDLIAADPMLQVSPGYGISVSGDDVSLLRTLRTALGSLTVVDLQSGKDVSSFGEFAKNPMNQSFAGVFLLQPIVGQVSGASIETGTGPIVVSGNLDASCDQDPLEFAFEDWQMVDGVRLVLAAWPSSIPLPAFDPATWRNRLVYAVFEAEMALSEGDQLPWNLAGVPLALAGFNSGWTLSFADRSSVVRAGGLSRTRYILPARPGILGNALRVQPATAQARIAQLAEQLSQSIGFTSFVPNYAVLPPVGLLPVSALDLAKQVALWFPPQWTVRAGPVHAEEIETVLLSGMTASPLDLRQSEPVDVLIPLPDSLYDPDVLITPEVDPAFQKELDQATLERDAVLQRRKAIQQEANALALAITGTKQPAIFNLDGGLTADELTARDAQVYTPTAGETFATALSEGGYVSTDVQKLLTDAQNAPYTIAVDGNGKPLAKPLALFSPDDLTDLTTNGLQHFVNRINAKLARANDLLDLAFLTTQTDIYRFRQHVLNTADATRLAVSPILANIATGDSAGATANNLQNYLSSILSSTTAAPVQTPAVAGGPAIHTALSPRLDFIKVAQPLRPLTLMTTPATLLHATSTVLTRPASSTFGTALGTGIGAKVGTAVSTSVAGQFRASTTFTPITVGTAVHPAAPTDIVGQSPIVGAQLFLRTLTIAERLKPSPSQEGIFYAVGNRIAILQLLADLEITIDDLTILVDSPLVATPAPAAGATTTTPAPGSFTRPTLADLRTGAAPLRRAAVLAAIESPQLNQDTDEANLFSTGVHVLEQHTQLLRGVEARVQQYRDFLTECSAALDSLHANLPAAETLLTQLENHLAQTRQDLAFTTVLLKDETQRVSALKAKRADTLANYVQFVAYTRTRSLSAEADVPSRQLVPGNASSPVPSCLQQTVAIPPELREVAALLREAPVHWLPAIQALLNRLERPRLLHEVAVNAQARAAMQLQLPMRASSAASARGVYAPVISNIYGANQQFFRNLQAERAAFQTIQLVNQSWAMQIQILQTITAVADLIAGEAVHAEVVNATSRLMQQISSVATCLYVRAGQTLPVDRLAWAEFLRGLGLSIQLRNLAVLPQWNTLPYVSRQQMQLLVDWLFQQIDARNADAAAFMSDVVRVAILLASHAPVDDVLAGAVTIAVTPKVGGIVALTIPSNRVAHGMFVHLYSGGQLAAHAVVSDIDSSVVRATVTAVYLPGVALKATDVAHFTSQPPQALVARAFDKIGAQ